MITKKYNIDFHSNGGALTLSPDCIGKHENGWTITGKIHEDYYEWVNEFEAQHETFGKVWGDFENEVYADSLEAYNDFIKHFEPEAWDYDDI